MSFGRMGARGVANEELTPDFCLRMSQAAAAHLDADRVALGRDTRLTGEMLEHAATAGVTSAGADVDRLGIAPTPAVQQYASSRGIPALQITASHNPPEYNGVKLIGDDGVVLDREAVRTVKETMASDRRLTGPWESVGRSRRVEGATDEYVDGILAEVDRSHVAEHRPLVVLDPGHGAGATTSPELLRRLGCRVRTINAQPDGRFPGRDPEPTRDALGDLMRSVVAMDADVGIAHDGDADRVLFVDETGEFVEGDAALAALARAELSPGEVVVTAINTSKRLADVVDEVGAEVEYTPIGNSHILGRIRTLRADGASVAIAGEGNGGVIYPDHHLNRDGGYVAARFLELTAGRRVSDVVAPHRGYALERENVPYDSEAERTEMLSRAEAWATAADGSLTTLDGVRVDLGDEWALVRPSGTEPYVRIYAEARTRERARELAEELRARITAPSAEGRTVGRRE